MSVVTTDTVSRMLLDPLCQPHQIRRRPEGRCRLCREAIPEGHEVFGGLGGDQERSKNPFRASHRERWPFWLLFAVVQQGDGEAHDLACIQGVCSTMLATVGKYDNFHLHDHQFNRTLVYRFLRGAIAFHLKYIEVMTKKDELRDYAARNDQDRLAAVCLFPTMVQFRLVLSRTQEVMQAFTPEQKTATPAQVFDQADEEILMRVHAGILEVQEEATQEGRPKPTDFLQGHSPTKSRTQLLLTMESKRFGHMIFSRPHGFHASFHANNWYNLCFHAASHCGLLRYYRAVFLSRAPSLCCRDSGCHIYSMLLPIFHSGYSLQQASMLEPNFLQK